MTLYKALYWPSYFREGTEASSRTFLGMLKWQLGVLSKLFMLTQVYIYYTQLKRDTCIVFSLKIITFFFLLKGNIFFKKKLSDTSHPGCSLGQKGSVVIKGEVRTSKWRTSFHYATSWPNQGLTMGLPHVWTYVAFTETGGFENHWRIWKLYAAINRSKNYTDEIYLKRNIFLTILLSFSSIINVIQVCPMFVSLYMQNKNFQG